MVHNEDKSQIKFNFRLLCEVGENKINFRKFLDIKVKLAKVKVIYFQLFHLQFDREIWLNFFLASFRPVEKVKAVVSCEA